MAQLDVGLSIRPPAVGQTREPSPRVADAAREPPVSLLGCKDDFDSLPQGIKDLIGMAFLEDGLSCFEAQALAQKAKAMGINLNQLTSGVASYAVEKEAELNAFAQRNGFPAETDYAANAIEAIKTAVANAKGDFLRELHSPKKSSTEALEALQPSQRQLGGTGFRR